MIWVSSPEAYIADSGRFPSPETKTMQRITWKLWKQNQQYSFITKNRVIWRENGKQVNNMRENLTNSEMELGTNRKKIIKWYIIHTGLQILIDNRYWQPLPYENKIQVFHLILTKSYIYQVLSMWKCKQNLIVNYKEWVNKHLSLMKWKLDMFAISC